MNDLFAIEPETNQIEEVHAVEEGNDLENENSYKCDEDDICLHKYWKPLNNL